ncbi:MAG: hypothetical protein KC777_27460 [Cyanobacteria bacterium HKST-UBA02]|nr:hypothetical protein [Cyanobacteria bacterium HKST-UBA02]
MTRAEQTESIADLLHKCGIITQDQLARAMATSIRTSAPIGNVLVDTGVIPRETLRTASIAQSLLDEKLISVDQLASVIRKSVHEKISLEEAFEQLGLKTDAHLVTARLSQILSEAGMVTGSDLEKALEASLTSGLPLGRVLVVRSVLPDAVAYAALTAQVLIREGKITAEQAITALKLSQKNRTTIESALREIGALSAARSEPIRLGEILIAAELVGEIDLLSAVEKGMGQQMPIGQVLLQHGLITPGLLNRALSLQFMINNRNMNPVDAVANLKTAAARRNEADFESSQFEASPYPVNDHDLQGQGPDFPEPAFGIYKKEDWMRIIQELTLEKQNLAFKVVSQQEEMKYRLARELHDTIIADLMMLKRYLGGDKKLTVEETIEIVDHVIRQLRDICSDFAPRNFREWGLKMCLADMVERLGQRTGITTAFKCDLELPELPDPVGLHIFRIVQEGLNNVEKYSGASRVNLEIESPREKFLRFSLSDNGRGFDPAASESEGTGSNSGGMGLGGMKERADLIRCFYTTSLLVDSAPGEGSMITLEIELI